MKQERVSDASSRRGHFHQILILSLKMVELPQMQMAMPIPIVAKSSILDVGESLGPSVKTMPCTKPSPDSCGNQFFSIISKCCHFYWNSLCFSLLLFKVWWSIFGEPFRRFLLLLNYSQKSKFHYRSLLLWSISSPLVNIQLKRLNPLCWAHSELIIFRFN